MNIKLKTHGILALSALLYLAISGVLLPTRLALPPEITFNNDAGSYHLGAVHLARSGFYSVDGIHPTLQREPGLSLFLAALYRIFGEGNRTAIFIAQTLLHLLGVLLFCRELRLMSSKSAAVIAGIFLLLLPPVFHSNFTVYRESLALSLFLLAATFLLSTKRTGRFSHALLAGLFLGGVVLTYMSFMFLPIVLLPALFFLRVRPAHIAIAIGLPLLFRLSWGARNAWHEEWVLVDPFPVAGILRMRAIHAEMQRPLDPLRCVWVEYVSRDRSQEPLPRGICRPEEVLDVDWVKPYPQTIEEARLLQQESKRRIVRHLPMYLWGTVVWAAEYHFPFLNGWGFAFNVASSLGTLLVYGGCAIAIIRVRRLWRNEYLLFLLPILYGTASFSLMQAFPRYRMPTLFAYCALAGIGYASLKRNYAFLRIRQTFSPAVRFLLEHSAPLRFLGGKLLSWYVKPEMEWDGHTVAVNPKDFGVALELQSTGEYEVATIAYCKKMLKPGMVFVDVGANIGLFTLMAARQVGPAGHVYAFEPDAGNSAFLRKNIERNGYRNVTCIAKAISDRSGTCTLFLSESNPSDHRTYHVSHGRKSISIECVSLDEFFPVDARIDMIKMDIEGAEGIALKGMNRILTAEHPPELIIECFPSKLEKVGADPLRLLQSLEEKGFLLSIIDDALGTMRPLDAASIIRECRKISLANVLCVRR